MGQSREEGLSLAIRANQRTSAKAAVKFARDTRDNSQKKIPFREFALKKFSQRRNPAAAELSFGKIPMLVVSANLRKGKS